jgi:esterase/lipase
MKIVIKIGKWLFSLLLVLYIATCAYLYFQQEDILFHPTKLSSDFQYDFDVDFEEKVIVGEDGTILSGVLFKAVKPKGLVFYLHGNGGAITTCVNAAQTYTNINYDCFVLDYRGFGKSEGEIISQNQFYSDVEIAYDSLCKYYEEKNILIVGYSIGTGPASMLASKSNAKHLILLAPYYSMLDMMNNKYPLVPGYFLEYKLKTCEFIPKVKSPISIFHGDADEIIYYGSSVKLREHFSSKDELISLSGQKHGGMNENPIFIEWLRNKF